MTKDSELLVSDISQMFDRLFRLGLWSTLQNTGIRLKPCKGELVYVKLFSKPPIYELGLFFSDSNGEAVMPTPADLVRGNVPPGIPDGFVGMMYNNSSDNLVELVELIEMSGGSYIEITENEKLVFIYKIMQLLYTSAALYNRQKGYNTFIGVEQANKDVTIIYGSGKEACAFPNKPQYAGEKPEKSLTAEELHALTEKLRALFEKQYGTMEETEHTDAHTPLIYKISVSLEAGCYRHIVIDADATLFELHRAIISAFSFEDNHAHAFFMTNQAWDDRDAYFCDMIEEEELYTTEHTVHQTLREGQKFLYIFDFGDEWRFHCKVLSVKEGTCGKARVVRSVGESPEQYGFSDDFFIFDEDFD